MSSCFLKIVRNQTLIKLLVSSCFIVFSCTPGKAQILLSVDEAGLLHANLQNVSLPEVKSFFEQTYGIKFKGNDNLFQDQLTITFNNIELEKALKRIFSKMNVVFSYNSQGKIEEISLLPGNRNKAPSHISSKLQTKTNRKKNTRPQAMAESPVFQDVQNSLPPGGSGRVILNSPPSGDSFKIVPSAPPSRK